MSAPISYEDYVASLDRLTVLVHDVDYETRRPFEEAARALIDLPEVTRSTLAALIRAHPAFVPMLGSVCGLGQEALKNTLRHGLQTAGWVKVSRERPEDVVALLDDQFALVERAERERQRDWSYADVLLERSGARRTAGRAVGRGRGLEDDVEAVVRDLGLPYELRGRFVGARQATAPADLAIPSMGRAGIVCAMKGFDSTGSKLTDAVTEIDAMAKVRRPNQFIFAIVDGIGWKGRQGDLRRLYELWDNDAISGLYTRRHLDSFRVDIVNAARILGLL